MSTKTKKKDLDYFFYENKARDAGFSIVAGVDEAGRGPLAGPVVAGAVVVNKKDFESRIDDSKKLTEKMRERAFLEIIGTCDVGVGVVDVEDIDRLNIFNASLLAMKRAVRDLRVEPEHLLIDGRMDIPIKQTRTFLIKGESLSISIACASIIAKVSRDRMMVELDKKYPVYGFKRHKGYGTQAHIEAIRKYGLCPVHRKTFGPFGSRKKVTNRR